MASEQMENLKKIMQQMMAAGFSPKFDGEADPMTLRKVVQTAQAHMALEPGITYEPCTLAGMEAEKSVPEGARSDAVILYMHGGGLICGNTGTSRGYAGMLAGESKIPVYAFTYRLAPENKFPAAADDAYAAYQAVLEREPGKPVFLIGESAGAYLSVVTALRARDKGITMPAGIVPYSAPIDFSGVIDRHFPGNKDFTVTPDGFDALVKWYCKPDQDLKDPYLSPYYADYRGMCPMFIAWDESESLSRDSEALRDKAEAAGVEVEWKSYPDCFHAFPTSGRGTPESYEVMKETVAFFNRHIG